MPAEPIIISSSEQLINVLLLKSGVQLLRLYFWLTHKRRPPRCWLGACHLVWNYVTLKQGEFPPNKSLLFNSERQQESLSAQLRERGGGGGLGLWLNRVEDGKAAHCSCCKALWECPGIWGGGKQGLCSVSLPLPPLSTHPITPISFVLGLGGTECSPSNLCWHWFYRDMEGTWLFFGFTKKRKEE